MNTIKNLEDEINHLNKKANDLVYELAITLAENTQLRAALKDCMGYVDVDNLTMQTKNRNWQVVLDGKNWNPSNIDIEL